MAERLLLVAIVLWLLAVGVAVLNGYDTIAFVMLVMAAGTVFALALDSES